MQIEPPAAVLSDSPAARGLAIPRPTPLWAVFLFTFLNSIGTGVVTNGIVFMTKHGYGFTDIHNYWLGILLGVTYIAGALGAQPLLAQIRRILPTVSTRAILGFMMVLMAMLCAIPQLALWLHEPAPGELRPSWPVWTTVAIYSPLTGILWPLVESYLSGGRSGANLRRVVSRWNIVWSSAVVASYLFISRFVESQPALCILILGGVHLVCLWLLMSFSKEPAPHDADEHEPHPPIYRKLLITFRLLLPMSYIVSSALGPYLPGAMNTLKIESSWQTIVASSWLAPRVLMFIVLDRWQGWHGRWFPAILGGLFLLAGFTATVLSKEAGSIALLITGLATFGVGMAVVYAGAIYYALEVGQAEVQAGGKHEALIGVGYTVGPGIFLIVSIAVSQKWLPQSSFEPTVIGTVAVIGVLVAGMVVQRVLKGVKTTSIDPN